MRHLNLADCRHGPSGSETCDVSGIFYPQLAGLIKPTHTREIFLMGAIVEKVE